MAGLSLIRQRGEGSSGKQRCQIADHASERRKDRSARQVIWRAGHDQRAIVVRRQSQGRLRKLSVAAIAECLKLSGCAKRDQFYVHDAGASVRLIFASPTPVIETAKNIQNERTPLWQQNCRKMIR